MHPFSNLVQRFMKKSPVCVMARASIERLFASSALDALFDEHAQEQYTRELTFSTLVDLVCDVILNIAPSVHSSYQQRAEEMPVSVTAVYDKLNRIEPQISEALLRYSYAQVLEVAAFFEAPVALLPGYRTKIIDGNHLSATEHRPAALREESAAPLPGKSVVVLDADRMAICDVFLEEDGHAQERRQIPSVLERVEAGELWIADRHYSTQQMFFELSERGALSLIRQHGSMKPEALSQPVLLAETESGTVYEQEVQITRKDESMRLRRIRIDLLRPTRSGEKQIYLLSTVPSSVADGVELSLLYLKRWRIEKAFHELTTTLSCEIKTLAYPKAALFCFTLALVAYNVVSLIKTAMRSVHGRQRVENDISAYYLTLEIRQCWQGMQIAVPEKSWKVFAKMSSEEFADCLREIAKQIRLSRYRKHTRGPKKKARRKPNTKRAHISTTKVLAQWSAP